jgi:hypothetical protein
LLLINKFQNLAHTLLYQERTTTKTTMIWQRQNKNKKLQKDVHQQKQE